MVSGVGEAGELPQHHLLQGGNVAEPHHQQPGHVDRKQQVHMKEIPGKLNYLLNLIPGSSAHGDDSGARDVYEEHVGRG